MLAELREQAMFLARLPELRATFERFVTGGTRKSGRPFRPKDTYLWEREEVLNVDGKSFMLEVATIGLHRFPREADLEIKVSGPDGREVREVLPSEESLLKHRNVGDFIDLPERLEELKTNIDTFLGPRKPNFFSTG